MKRAAVIVAAALALLTIGGVIGRATAPSKSLETTKTAEASKESKSDVSAEVLGSTLARGSRSDQEVRIARVSRPDGTRMDLTTIRTRTAAETKETATAARAEVRTEYVDRWKTIEKTKLVETGRPQWEAGLLAGYRLMAGGPSFGGFLERRIFAGIKIGAFATTEKTVGVMVGVEW